MRALIIVSLALAAAGCSEEAKKEKAEEAAAEMGPGQWEVASEIASITPTDKGAPKFTGKAGDKATVSVCVGAGDKGKPPVRLFTGDDDVCQYQNSYIRKGRINASLNCTRAGLEGAILRGVEGKFKADSFDATVTTTTMLVSDGDVKIAAKLEGRRTGDCVPEPAAEAGKQG